jgi:peptide/nickel transport system ATP-binding protein
MSKRIAVMYLGKIVEIANYKSIFKQAQHPYTQALLSAVTIPKLDVKRTRLLLEGDIPSPINPPPGCRFCGRCIYRQAICQETMPELVADNSGGLVACHFAGKLGM